MNSLNKYEITKNENRLPEGKLINNNKFWNEFFFRIGNGESLRGVSKDLGIPFQTVWSAIMSDDKRRAAYEAQNVKPFHASKIEEILEDRVWQNRTACCKANDARKWLASKMYRSFSDNASTTRYDG